MRVVQPSAAKRSGKYYTPPGVADALCDWAVRHRTDTVLDPSFGGCAFLDAAAGRLRSLGARRPVGNLHGFDTDRRALRSLARLLGQSIPGSRFGVPRDFLASVPGSNECPLVDVVVGNPPYVRHHLLKGTRRIVARDAALSSGYDLSEKSSYWGYFVLHAVRCLKPGGRLAFVLPMSLLTTDYADTVRAVLFQGFGRTRVIIMDQRLFEGAEERSVVVLADGWSNTHEGVSVERARDAQALSAAVSEVPAKWNGHVLLNDRNAWRRELAAEDALQLMEQVRAKPQVHSLGDIADISLGVVTGANGYFVRPSSHMRESNALPRQRHRILSGARSVGGLVADRQTFEVLRRKGEPCELLLLRKGDGRTGVRGYLQSTSAKGAKTAYKCRAREPWFVLGPQVPPSAFLTPLSGPYPRLILNGWRLDCTNSLYRVNWKLPITTRQAQLVALSVVSSLGSLSAELAGRVYAGGALKLEPRDARKVSVVVSDAPIEKMGGCFTQVSGLLSMGDWVQAQAVADEFVLRNVLLMDRPLVRQLQAATMALRMLRQAK
jgi:adenine-specific DNA-methyltransferase